jgi:putative addiction module CopG family antidote
MNIALPEHIQRFVEEEVASGRYHDAQQVIVTALEWMADDRRIAPDVLAELIAEPLAQIERGETIPWSDDLMDRLSREAESNARRGHQVSDDITY